LRQQTLDAKVSWLLREEAIMTEKEKRGFASMDLQKQREIASKGGKAAHERGTAHEFDSSEAREAGRKGGKIAHEKGTAHEFTSDEAREAGRKGGQARSKSVNKPLESDPSTEMGSACSEMRSPSGDDLSSW
jgi:general stress protein YciG